MIDVVLSRVSGVPFYRQIEVAIADQIRSGRLPEGTALPSIRELAKQVLVSVITTKQAYESLERDGLVTSVQGKGTFVCKVKKREARTELHDEISLQLQTIVQRAKDAQLSSDDLLDAFNRHVRSVYSPRVMKEKRL